MIDPLSLLIGAVGGAVVGVGGGIWFVKRKLQQMQDDMFGQMGGMMQDPAAQQQQPDMEAVMGGMMQGPATQQQQPDMEAVMEDMMDMMGKPDEAEDEYGADDIELRADDIELEDDVDVEK